MSTDNGGPAFPMQDQQAIHAYAMAKIVDVSEDERDRAYLVARAEAIGGMTLLDRFAEKAMRFVTFSSGCLPESAARCYEIADAMLAERAKRGQA